MKKIKNLVLNVNELVNQLGGIKGCSAASVVYTTDAEHMNKKFKGGKSNPLYGRVKACTYLTSVNFNASFNNAIDNRLGKDNNYNVEPLPWGVWCHENKVIAHNDKFYIRLYKSANTTSKVVYYIDGHIASDNERAMITEALRERPASKKQTEAGIEVAQQVKPFNITADSIKTIHVAGLRMTIL